LYQQLQNAINVGAKTIYGAMFDEYDEVSSEYEQCLTISDVNQTGSPDRLRLLCQQNHTAQIPLRKFRS